MPFDVQYILAVINSNNNSENFNYNNYDTKLNSELLLLDRSKQCVQPLVVLPS